MRQQAGVRFLKLPVSDKGAYPVERLTETIFVIGFQEIIERANVERLDGVLGVRGNEHDGGWRTVVHCACDLDTADARHLDVEENGIGSLLADLLSTRTPARGLTDELELGVLCEEGTKPQAREWLVVDNYRAYHRRVPTLRGRGRTVRQPSWKDESAARSA